MPRSNIQYRGRFAPSPTGPLHLGSLIAALASYLDARHCTGSWLVRMEDLDPPREEPGAADSILHSLQCHGLHWDENILYQSTRTSAYAAALTNLADRGSLFPCDCTRAILTTSGACQGNCRTSQTKISGPAAVRISVPCEQDILFTDRLQGPRQIFLQQRLDYPTPRYCHLPVITTPQGQKFSKQNHAPALDNSMAHSNLLCALRFLHQCEPPAALASVEQLLAYAIEHWSLEQIPAVSSIPAASIGLSV